MPEETKEAVELRVKELAKKEAESVFASKAAEIFNSEDSKKLIKSLALEAAEGMKIKEANGKETAINVLVDEMQKQHDALSLSFKNYKEAKETAKTKSFGEAVKEELTYVKDALIELKGNRSATGVNFNMKAAATMLLSTNYSGGTVGLTSWDAEFARVQRRQPFMRELVRVLTTDSMYIAWAEQKNPDPGVAGTVAEGATKPKTDFDIVEASKKVEKIAVSIKTSKEMLADVKFLQSEINTELRELVELKLDEQILSGDNVSPNLQGILTVAPTFAAVSTLALLVPTPNRFDVLMAAAAQVAANNFTADTAVINTAEFYAMQLSKDTQGRYLLPPFSSVDGLTVAGLRIVANNGVTAGSFLVGDFKKDNLAIREELNIQIGYENDDFTKNLVTILAEMRAVNYIKSNHLNAFVKGVFATAITALTKP